MITNFIYSTPNFFNCSENKPCQDSQNRNNKKSSALLRQTNRCPTNTASCCLKTNAKSNSSGTGKPTKSATSSCHFKQLADGKDYRAFEILNLGKYERQHYIGVNPNLREAEQQKQLIEKQEAFIDLILRAYAAKKTDGFSNFQGKKTGRLVAIGF